MTYQTGGMEALLDRRGREIQSGMGSASARLEENWFGPTASKLRDISRNRITEAIRKLSEREVNWDTYGSARADEISIGQAIDAIETFIIECADQRLNWLDPHVGLNEDGQVALEWWCNHRRLTVYFSPEIPEFVCSWGPNIESQMDAGIFEPGVFIKHWRWLTAFDS